MSAVPDSADIAQGEHILRFLRITGTRPELGGLPSAAVLEAHLHEARLLTGDDYLIAQRLTHGGSTRLHASKQCSPFD
jgi:hypothetical protein